MALRDQNPKNLAFASKVDWSVAWIEILKGQVWGLEQNGGGGSLQVNSDWDATSGVAAILNKPNVVENPFTEDISAGSFKITSLATPTAGMDAVNKAYVDTFVQGLSPKTAVRVATTVTLVGTYNNGAGTFTMTATGVLTVDGINLLLGDRVLIKDQVDQSQNGIYSVTTEGIIGIATVFTRTTDADTGTELVSAYVQTGSEGSTQANKGYTQATPSPITIGTSPIVWNLFNSNTYGDGTGITIGSGNLINSNLSTGVPGPGNTGQPVRGGTTSEGALTIVGSISTDPRTTTAPAVIVSSAGPLGDDNTAQVHMSIPVTVAQTSTAGYTGLKLAVTETSLGSGTKNLMELLAGAAGTSSRFAVANTGTITVVSGANRFAFNTREVTAATDTFVIGDNEGTIFGNRATAQTFTVPLNSSVAFPIGARIDIIQKGAGKITIAGPGVTINSQGGFLSVGAQYVGVTLIKEAINTWYLIGNLIT
jgi:hypothetical protein